MATPGNAIDATPLLVDEVAAAKLLGLGIATVQRLRYAGKLPYVQATAKRIKYYVPDLHEWARSQRVRAINTAET